MAQLSEDKRKAQKYYATRAIAVRFSNQKPGEPSKWLFDNQYMYKLKRRNGFDAKYWEKHFKDYLKKNAAVVVEASLHDVTQIPYLTEGNRIEQLVTNGHFLY
jgi:hypothetical protein